MGEAKRRRAAKQAIPKMSMLLTVSLAPEMDGYVSMYFVPGSTDPTVEQLAGGLIKYAEKAVGRRLWAPMVLSTGLDKGDDEVLRIMRRTLLPDDWAAVERDRLKPPCFTAIWGHHYDAELMAIH